MSDSLTLYRTIIDTDVYRQCLRLSTTALSSSEDRCALSPVIQEG
jgi:hypothetical protein